MKRTEAGQLKKSFLLARDVSLKDIMSPAGGASFDRSAIFGRKNHHDEKCDEGRELFKGLKFKNLCSIQTTDGELAAAEIDDSPKPKKADDVVKQKLRQQVDKLKKSMSSTLITRALEHPNEQTECNTMKTLKVQKKEDELKRFNKIRKMSESYALQTFNFQ